MLLGRKNVNGREAPSLISKQPNQQVKLSEFNRSFTADETKLSNSSAVEPAWRDLQLCYHRDRWMILCGLVELVVYTSKINRTSH